MKKINLNTDINGLVIAIDRQTDRQLYDRISKTGTIIENVNANILDRLTQIVRTVYMSIKFHMWDT